MERLSRQIEEDWKSREILNVKAMQSNYKEILAAVEKTQDAHIVFKDDENEVIVALIDNFHASLAIGSENWCISSVYYGGATPGSYFWDWYVGEKKTPDRRQYFVWALKHPSDDYKLVGTTTNESENEFYCAYNFPNSPFNMESYIKSVPALKREMFFNNDALRTNPSNV